MICGESTRIAKALQDVSANGRLPLAPLSFFSPKVRFRAHLNTIALMKTCNAHHT